MQVETRDTIDKKVTFHPIGVRVPGSFDCVYLHTLNHKKDANMMVEVWCFR